MYWKSENTNKKKKFKIGLHDDTTGKEILGV